LGAQAPGISADWDRFLCSHGVAIG
jgi:hypothetical protein